jgi:hypothetical protein
MIRLVREDKNNDERIIFFALDADRVRLNE